MQYILIEFCEKPHLLYIILLSHIFFETYHFKILLSKTYSCCFIKFCKLKPEKLLEIEILVILAFHIKALFSDQLCAAQATQIDPKTSQLQIILDNIIFVS